MTSLKRIAEQVRSTTDSGFVRGSVVYLTGNVVNSLLPFLLLPVLTRYLTPTDYGLVATSVVLVQVIATAIGLNTSGLIVQSQFADDFETRRKLLSTNVLVAAALTAVLVGITLMVGGKVEEVTEFPAGWTPLLILVSLGLVVQQLYLSILQSRNEAKRFVGIQFLGSTLNLALSVLLVVAVGMDWRGRILATAGAGAVVAIVCLRGLTVRLKLLAARFDRVALVSILRFGVPLVPHVAGGWAMTMAPRLYLNNLAAVGDTGLFGVAYNLASPVAMVVGAANQAYMPALFSRLASRDAPGRLQLARLLLVGGV